MAIGTQLKVDLGDRSYPIHFGKRASGLMWAEMEGLLAEGRPVVAVTDGGFSEAQEGYLRKIPEGIPTFVLPAGEASKSIHSLRRVYDFLSDSALDRRGAVFALGGGMVGDLAGFAAATLADAPTRRRSDRSGYHRDGISHCRRCWTGICGLFPAPQHTWRSFRRG